jgi:hypothetical protein
LPPNSFVNPKTPIGHEFTLTIKRWPVGVLWCYVLTLFYRLEVFPVGALYNKIIETELEKLLGSAVCI